MTASPLATVVPFRKAKRGRPTKADELQIELDSRRLEERRFARDAEPLLRRLSFLAVELGPASLATVNHLSYLHSRHRQRWTSEPDGDAAA